VYDHYVAQVRRQVEELRQQLSAARATIDGQQRDALKGAALLRATEAERDSFAAGIPLICCDERHEAKVRGLEELLTAGQKATVHWEEAYAREVRAHGATERALAAAEARIAAIRTLHQPDDIGRCAGCRDPRYSLPVTWPCPTTAALDGPAEQSAGPPQLSPASIAAPEPVQPPTLTSMFELAERARAEHDAEQQHLEASIRVTAWVAKLTVRRTEPVEQIAGVPAALARLTATIAELASVTAPTRTAGLVNWLTNAPSLPLVPDESLPAGEVHLRPHPRTAGGPS